MALSKIQTELEKLEKFLFSPSRKSNLFFQELSKERHRFTFNVKDTVDQLLEHAEDRGFAEHYPDEKKRIKGSRTNVYKKYKERIKGGDLEEEVLVKPFSGKDALLTKFAKELLKKYKAEIPNKQGSDVISNDGEHITFTVESKLGVRSGKPTREGAAYQRLVKWKGAWGKAVIDGNKEYERMFSKSEQYMAPTGGGFGKLTAVGHDTAFAEEKAAQLGSKLQEVDQRLKAEGIASNAEGTFTKVFSEHSFNLDLGAVRRVNINKGELLDHWDVETNLEGGFVNSVLKANRGYMSKDSEREIGTLTKNFLRAKIEEIESFYKGEGAKFVEHEGSISFLDALESLLLNNILRRNLHKNKNIKVKQAKSLPKRTASVSRSIKTGRADHKKEPFATNIKVKTGKKSMQGGDVTRQGYASILPSLPSLINIKLGDTILGNMGLPGLVSQTGTFAGSARVTSAVAGPEGVPVIDYSYQKNPYEVFETGGRGRVPWATTARDPRTIIDKSIREIAAEMALGAFTTRRV